MCMYPDVIGWHTPTYSIVMQQCHSHTNTGIIFWCVGEVFHQSSDVLQTGVTTSEQRENCKCSNKNTHECMLNTTAIEHATYHAVHSRSHLVFYTQKPMDYVQ